MGGVRLQLIIIYLRRDFTSQIVGPSEILYPTNKEVSYTNLMWLDPDLKNRLLLLVKLLLLLIIFNLIWNAKILYILIS
jgi:hypothetical protein